VSDGEAVDVAARISFRREGESNVQMRLLDFLCCPDCRDEQLEVTTYKSGDGATSRNIVEGAIHCRGCGSSFPIIDGVPRLLPVSLRHYVVSSYPNFFERYPSLKPPGTYEPQAEKIAGTLEAYSYQYSKLHERENELERWKQTFLSSIPVEPAFFKGKVGLDVGCGIGRHLYWAHKFGAEMVGIDLTASVDQARNNTKESGRCHFVQADIYHLPFKRGVFDFAYSIGVLHFLPNPYDGFRKIVPVVKPSGKIFVWVYGLNGMRLSYRLSHLTWLRGIGPRLPAWAQYGFSMLLVFLLELLIWLPCRAISLLPGGESTVARIPLGDSCRRPFMAKIRSVFNRLQPPVVHYHTAQELDGWFKAEGLRNIVLSSRQGRGWITAGDRA
jgi:SAM-dependent methyltransferase